ncbi:MAG: zinc ribbon domain-containing protein [Pontixanthobacter sp.]
MAKFCAECGAQLDPQAKFCASCGTSVAQAASPTAPSSPPSPTPPFPVQDAPIAAHGAPLPPHFDPVPPNNNGKIIGIALAVGGVAIAAALAAYMFLSPSKESDSALTETVQVAATAEDPNAPRPQAWFDEYSDTFQSAELTRLVAGTAQKRSFPTAKGSEVVETMKPGIAVTGRWVEGADPKTRWLKTNDGGYIWEGNLAGLETITSAGMLGMIVGSPFQELRRKIDPVGHLGGGDPSWDSQACDTYTSLDGAVDVMVEQGKATSFTTTSSKLATAKNIKVGSSETDLRKAYGAKLKEEPNPYDGTDYFVWDSKDRGIKFHVASDGRVEFISSGTRSIEYVEGCL